MHGCVRTVSVRALTKCFYSLQDKKTLSDSGKVIHYKKVVGLDSIYKLSGVLDKFELGTLKFVHLFVEGAYLYWKTL